MKLDEIVLKAESIVKMLKPIAEEVCGFKLNKPKISLSKLKSHMSMKYYHDEIFINRKFWEKIGVYPHRTLNDFELDIAHELGHHVSYTINPKKINELELKIVDEGFAEYFSLDLLPKGVLSEKFVDSHRDWVLKSFSFYGVGYRFFRKVIDSLDKKEAFNVIRNLDITLEEIYAPGLYVERRQNGNPRKN